MAYYKDRSGVGRCPKARKQPHWRPVPKTFTAASAGDLVAHCSIAPEFVETAVSDATPHPVGLVAAPRQVGFMSTALGQCALSSMQGASIDISPVKTESVEGGDPLLLSTVAEVEPSPSPGPEAVVSARMPKPVGRIDTSRVPHSLKMAQGVSIDTSQLQVKTAEGGDPLVGLQM